MPTHLFGRRGLFFDGQFGDTELHGLVSETAFRDSL